MGGVFFKTSIMKIEYKVKQLIKEGYNAFRKVKWDSINKEWEKQYINTDSINTTYLRANFNVMKNGCIGIFFEKKGEKEIYFGLHTKNKIILN